MATPNIFGNLVKASVGLGFLNGNDLIKDYRDWMPWTPAPASDDDNENVATYTIISSDGCLFKKIGSWTKLIINLQVSITDGGTLLLVRNLPVAPNKGTWNGNLLNVVDTGVLDACQATLLVHPPYQNQDWLVLESDTAFGQATSLEIHGEFIYQSNGHSQF